MSEETKTLRASTRPVHISRGSATTRVRIALASLLAIVGLSALWTCSASAMAPVEDFKISVSTTQAGAHPDLLTHLVVGDTETQNFQVRTASAMTRKTSSSTRPPG